MDVKCAAKVSGADAKMDETSVRLRSVTDHTLSQERHIYNTGKFDNHWFICMHLQLPEHVLAIINVFEF